MTNRIIGWARRLLPKVKSRQRLPDSLVELLRTRAIIDLQSALREYFRPGSTASAVEDVLLAARQLGWDGLPLEKLEVIALYYQGNIQSAYEKARKFLSDPWFDPDLFVLGCMMLYNSNQFSDAYALLKSGGNKPDQLDGRLDYQTIAGLIYLSTDRRKEAQAAFRRGREIDPDDVYVLFNSYAFCFELGAMGEFEQVKCEVMSKYGDWADASLAVAYVELARNRYADGFHIMERRYEMNEIHRYMNKAILSRPRWEGEALDGRKLLVTAEQGLGDTIMMARYFGALGELTHDVHIECQVEAVSLLTHNFPDLRMVPTKYGELHVKNFDVWTGSMSLPHVFATNCETVPGTAGYLRVPPDYRDYWRDRVRDLGRAGRFKVGIAWSGQPTHRADARRSLTTHRVFPLIEALPDVDFFALQTKVPADRPVNLHDVSEEMATLADTAALIDEMDLIVTVDTSVVHLAGAIGKPTWLLLPYRYEWRWGLEGEANCWYDSVRVLRQPAPGAWAPVLSRAFGRELRRYITNHSGNSHEAA